MKKFEVKVRVNDKYNPTERTMTVETSDKNSAERMVLSELKGLKRSREFMGTYVPNGKVTVLETKEVKEK